MKDISLHLMDILQNSIRAEASHICIAQSEQQQPALLQLTVADNGQGMAEHQLAKLQARLQQRHPPHNMQSANTSGLGLSLLTKAAKDTGGTVVIESSPLEGTIVSATFFTEHPLCKPLGGVATTIALCIVTHPHIRFTYRHTVPGKESFVFDTQSFSQPPTPAEYATIVQLLQT